jgi:hypothetical protein
LGVSENRVLRRIFGPERAEVTEGWRSPHNEELLNLYASPNIMRVFKSRRVRWTEYVARMEMRSENLKGRYSSEDSSRWGDNITMVVKEVDREVDEKCIRNFGRKTCREGTTWKICA